MKDKIANLPEDLGARALFACMNEEYVENVVGSVLASLGRASPEAKRSFSAELDKLNLRVPGFRKASVALRSNPQRLKEPVQRVLIRSDGLAAAALKIWAESNDELRQIVQERIEDVGPYIGVSAERPDSPGNSLSGHWETAPWEREKSRFAELRDNLDEDDIALMMCYVSGKLPGMADSEREADPVSEAVEQLPDILKLLALCAVDLEQLPVSAPEWESAIPEFAARIAQTVSAKEEERNRAATLDSFIADIAGDFSPELAYLESDTSSWSAAELSDGQGVPKALAICEELRSALTEYRTARESPPAETRSENRERRNKIDQLEDRVLNLLDNIARLMSGEPVPDDDPPPKSDRDRGQPEPAPPVSDASPKPDAGRLARENDSLKSENVNLKRENRTLIAERDELRSENERLERDKKHLRSDIEDVKRESRAELNKARDESDRWRIAYESERDKPRLTVDEARSGAVSVDEAVEFATQLFPDRLLVKPNSKSQVEDNPFEKPEDVWLALEWLATTYHDAKAGIASVPDFDRSIREACGWQYKSDQHETTRNKYRDWYTVKANNKTYWLLEHIGSGASKDARHTIRVAFDWDKDEKLVVVGYIGQHQRTDAT